MLSKCNELEYLDISKFKLSNISKYESIFTLIQNGTIIVNEPLLIKKLNKNN